MNDYPYNRIVLDIVELLHDLRDQGMSFIFNIHSLGGFDCTLFEDQAHCELWCDGKREALLRKSVYADDHAEAGIVYNELIKYKKRDEVEL